MKPEQRARWRAWRTLGKRRFVFTFGLYWGMGMFIALLASDVLPDGTFVTPWRLFGHLGIFLVGGMVLGLTSWNWAEKKYASSQEPDENTDSNG